MLDKLYKNHTELKKAFDTEWEKNEKANLNIHYKELWTLVYWDIFKPRKMITYMMGIVNGKHHKVAYMDAKNLK